MVWGACTRLLRDHHAAEDAFLATLVASPRPASAIRRTKSVPAWLHRVAVRASQYLLRRDSRRPLVSLDQDLIDPRPDPAERAATAELIAGIDSAINRLPERLRQVLVLCELRGDSLTEVAARLQCPVGTVASRLARARGRLRKMLSARGLIVSSVAGLLAVESVPADVRAATLELARGGAGVPPAVSALVRRASGAGWGGMAHGLVATLAAGLTAVAIALGM